jgi:hypothetical protein
MRSMVEGYFSGQKREWRASRLVRAKTPPPPSVVPLPILADGEAKNQATIRSRLAIGCCGTGQKPNSSCSRLSSRSRDWR